MQDRCGAATCPSRMISSTVSSVPCWVEPPAPKVTEKYLGCNSASLARVMRNFSVPSGVLGGKNSMLKLCGVMTQVIRRSSITSRFKQQRGQGPGNDAVQQGTTDCRPETGDVEATHQLRHHPEHQAVDDQDEETQREQGNRQGQHNQHRAH